MCLLFLLRKKNYTCNLEFILTVDFSIHLNKTEKKNRNFGCFSLLLADISNEPRCIEYKVIIMIVTIRKIIISFLKRKRKKGDRLCNHGLYLALCYKYLLTVVVVVVLMMMMMIMTPTTLPHPSLLLYLSFLSFYVLIYSR
ncbi:hypothetical protein J3Q64DRAFT_1077861 [Phycomyces blakesleeanus]|uniref:Uncharacterized protein n=1 Tax=Phycomyces blakesleeanus TaxID=4837 RepID=A0ABR3BG92_PHYBL